MRITRSSQNAFVGQSAVPIQLTMYKMRLMMYIGLALASEEYLPK